MTPSDEEGTPVTETPNPTRLCNLVMKGGITSGVIYPLAVVELSKAFRFKNIGGASAGAIAAAATAAAELGRHRRASTSFGLLATLPQFLGDSPEGETKGTNLFGFFQPQAGTRKLLAIAFAGLGGGRTAVLRVVATACWHFWLPFVIGGVPGVVLLVLGLSSPALSALILLSIGTALLALTAIIAGGSLLVAVVVAWRLFRQLPANFFGLCSGMPGVRKTAALALTPWLTA